MTCFNHTDLFWWHRQTKVQTGVIDLAVYDAGFNQIKYFETPNTIFLNRYVTNDLEFVNGTVIVTSDINLWTPKYIDSRINVTKIILNPGDGLMIHFNILDNKTFIDVVGVVENRPVLADFVNATVVSKENPIFNLITENPITSTIDVYIGILPNKRMLQKRRKRRQSPTEDFKLNYGVAFETPKCISWVSSGRTWDSTHCKVSIFLSSD